jgi:hypothetical protein
MKYSNNILKLAGRISRKTVETAVLVVGDKINIV